MTDNSTPEDQSQPWILEDILSDLAWTSRHTGNGWRNFFEKRGVQVRPRES
jgi:hypothetical protein